MMNVRLPSLVLLVTSLGFIGFGAACALLPRRMARYTEVELPSASARTDFAATYGGFQLGFGCFLLTCTRSPAWIEPGLVAAAAALAGFAGIRTLGIVASRMRVSTTIWLALGIELAGFALNVWTLRMMS
jgi:Domain of unknown function (DUF4345)